MTTTAPARTRPRPTFDQFTAIRRYQATLAFSPDGMEIAYSVNTSGQFNLWRQASDGGYSHQVTLSGEQAVRAIAWSPDAATLLYTADHHGDEFTRLYLVPARGGQPAPIPSEPDVRNFLGFGQSWSPDGRFIAYAGNDREPTDQDLLIRDVATGETARPLAGDSTFFAAGWSPDSRSLLAFEFHTNTDYDIHLVDVAAGSARLLTNHEGEIKFVPVGWAANGSGFYLLTDEGREFDGLAFYDLAAERYDWLETPEWEVEDAAVSADGRWLVWSVNEDGSSRLSARDLSTDRTIPLDLPQGVLNTMTLAPAGNRLGLLWERPDYPAEVFVVDLASGTANQITHSALGGIDAQDLTQPELIRYPTFDGKQIPALLYRPAGSQPAGSQPAGSQPAGSQPAGASGRLPVVLAIHGGPEAQERPRYAYAGLYQYLASRGIAVLAPNIRGSTGYGKSYQKLIHHDWGGGDLKDLEAAARYLRGLDWVDPARIGVFGGSYGGFATLSCVSRLPDYWAAAVDIVGPSNLVTFTKAVPPTWRRVMATWVGDPETEVDFLLARSPITYVDQIKAPLFVIQGANDPRVVKAESDQIVARLRERGVAVRYDVYDDEGHGFTKRENELRALRDTAAFFDEHLLVGGRRTEDGGRRTEDGGRRTED